MLAEPGLLSVQGQPELHEFQASLDYSKTLSQMHKKRENSKMAQNQD